MTPENTEQRKLAAIMFTDMVGYSALAQRDDKLALELLEEHRRLLREIFPRFHGSEIKTIGDAFLVEFGSALEAAQCAIEIQRTVAKRNHDVSVVRRIELKIGIHIGDVVHRDGDVYGDGVNIASRIEALAGAGGICVSTDVERQIRNALEARFEKFGSADLKNITLPMDLFRIVLPWESGSKAETGVARSSGKSPLLIAVAVLVVIALIAGWSWMQQSRRDDHENTSTASTNVVPATAPNAANQNSVAVLPFVNLSDDKGSEYFSDGVSEELLTVLQKIPGLHVAARTSAFSFKDKNATAQEIGRKLGVAYLVEGSVRRAGETVRIAARLTRADSGEELWSENYTRDLKDVFAVQTELAQTIVEQLRGRFAGTEATSKERIQAEVQAAEKGGTKNVEAHESYLQGRFFANQHSEKGTDQARAAYERAVQLDPKFALAWAGLAQTHIWDCNYATEGGQKGFNAHLVAAREAVERALTLEPDLPDALFARAVIETNFDYDWKGAAETLRKALAVAPEDPSLLAWAGSLAGARGETTQALEFFRRSVALDPVNAQARAFLAGSLSTVGHQEEARAEYAREIELNPSAPNSQAGIGLTYLLQGKFEEAAAAAQQDAADWARLLIVSCARWAQKRIPESNAALSELIAKTGETAAYQIAEAYGYRNDKDRAFEWLESARRQHDAGLPGLRSDTLLANLHGDPRWTAFLRTMGLADDQLK
jgi:TolB-like protein/Tfp pilus assembly protein PilF